MHGALQRHRGYQVAGIAPTLAQFGPHLPRMLRAAEAAGVVFVPVPPLTAVTIREKPVGMTAEITSDGDVARMTLGVDVDGELWRGERVRFVGNDRIVALIDDGHLQVAELDRDAPTVARRLIEEHPLEVPAAELDAFRGRLAGLLRHLTVRSPDGSVDVPAPARPTLLVTVGWRSSTVAELTWEWQYDDTHRCGLDDRDLLDGLRDRRAEATVRATVPDELLGKRTVRDGDALSLAIHDLPHLRGLPDVVVVEQQRPDFREATSAPEISFDVIESPSRPGETTDDYTDWLDLAVTVNVEGESIPLPDVIAALTLGHEFLVLPSGLFITTDRPEFDRLREVVSAAAELRERDGDRIAVGTHDLGLWAQLAETGIVDAQAAAWVARAQALRDLVEIPRPDVVGLEAELRTYQREGFWWLAFLWEHGLGGILADDMGLGKTLQVLALVEHARRQRPDAGPFLVVAPTSVVTAWVHEAERHAPGLRVGVCGRRTDDVAAIAADSDVVVTTYTVLRLARARYGAVSWGGLVLDEAQQVKNHQSKTYAAVRTIDAPFKLAVTGTPFENRLMELWALLSITVPGLYPWPRLFSERVARPVERGGDRAALDRFRAPDPPLPPAPHQGAGRERPAAQAGAGARRRARAEAPQDLRHPPRPRNGSGSWDWSRRTSTATGWRSSVRSPSCASSRSTRRWSTRPTTPSAPPSSTCSSTTWRRSPPKATAHWCSASSRRSSPGSGPGWQPRTSGRPTSTAPPATGRQSSTSSAPAGRPSSSSRSRQVASGSRSPRPTTSSCSTRGGTPPPRRRRSTGRTGSGRPPTCTSTDWSRATPSRRR